MKMNHRTSIRNPSISYPAIFCLMTVFSHCLAQTHYDYSDYSYRHGRDYHYDEEYDDDYDKTGHHVPKWNTLNLKHPNSIREPNNHFREPIQHINQFQHQIHQSNKYKHLMNEDNTLMNEDNNRFHLQGDSKEFSSEHFDEDVLDSDPIEEELRYRYKFDEHHVYDRRPQNNNVHGIRTKENQDYHHPHIDRSGEFVASPVDPGMSSPGFEEKTSNLFLTPHAIKSSYQPVYFQGAYRGQYVDRISKTRRSRGPSNRSVKSAILNSPLARGVNNIKNRIQRGGKKLFFRHNQGGLSGTSFDSPSYGGAFGQSKVAIMGNDITRFLLPLAAISLVALPTLATLTGLPYSSIIFPFSAGKRKRRSTRKFKHSKDARKMELQKNIEALEEFWIEQPLEERKDQVDMIMANYVTCSGVEGTVFDEIDEASSVENHCLEHIACLYGNEHSPLTNAERNVVAVVLHNMLENRYISNVLKQKLEEAVRVENSQAYDNPNVCNRYQCTMVFQPKKVQPPSSPTKHYFIRTFDNHITDNGKGNEYLNRTVSEKPRVGRNHGTEKRAIQTPSAKPDIINLQTNINESKVTYKEETKQNTHNNDDSHHETKDEEFGPDPRFPPFPTFPSFPNFPDFPGSRQH